MKKLTAEQFWAFHSKEYDTYMVSSTDKITFHIKDLYNFMDAYAQQANGTNASDKQESPIPHVSDSLSFTANDIDGVYLLGVFNTTGLDGLAKEIARLKKLKMNPSTMMEILKKAEQ